MKLVKVGEGLYRTDAGDATVIRSLDHARPMRWIVRHTDGIGCQVRRDFRTLDDVRVYLGAVSKT
jgi:hypothetical protein